MWLYAEEMLARLLLLLGGKKNQSINQSINAGPNNLFPLLAKAL